MTATNDQPSLQERYGPHTICFGCGPANAKGLHIRSFPDPAAPGDVVAEWTPSSSPRGISRGDERRHHRHADGLPLQLDSRVPPDAAPRRRQAADTVTADYHVRMLKPTPTDGAGPPARAGGGGDRRSSDGGMRAICERRGHGDLPRHVRGREAGPPGLRPLVSLRFVEEVEHALTSARPGGSASGCGRRPGNGARSAGPGHAAARTGQRRRVPAVARARPRRRPRRVSATATSTGCVKCAERRPWGGTRTSRRSSRVSRAVERPSATWPACFSSTAARAARSWSASQLGRSNSRRSAR